MDLIMTMFKPKLSMSPAKSLDTSSSNNNTRKRKHEPSPTRFSNGNSTGDTRGNKAQKTTEHHGSKRKKRRGFTFDEVKSLLDNLLSQDKKKLDASINVGLKTMDISSSVVPGHEAKECKELIDKLVHNTRRIRTLEEVLTDIKTNLNKRSYTDIILRSSIGEPPKRPPSAYLLFHQKRFKELQEEGETLAAEIAKRVSEEWKTLDDYERAIYFRQHEDEVKAYEERVESMGLTKIKKPTRPRTAKTMYVRSKMAERGNKLPKDKAKLAKLKQQLEEQFETDPKIREPWILKYNEEHQRYIKEQQQFITNNPHLDRNDIIKVRQSKLKIKPPAAPRNALRMYIMKKLPDGLEGQELKDTEAKLREKFDKMSTKKQLKYIKKAVKDKERYDTELEEFTRENPDFKVSQHKPNITQEQWRLYQSQVERKPQLPAPTAYLHFCSSRIKNLDDPYQAPTERLKDASEAWKKLGTEGQTKVHLDHVEYIKQYIEEMEAWLQEQDEKRLEQLYREEPKSKPEYWRKRISRLQKCNIKKESQEAAKKNSPKTTPDSDSDSTDDSD